MPRSIYNPLALQKLNPATTTLRAWAALISDTPEPQVFHQFLLNPESISWSRAASYDEGNIPGATVQPFQYKSTGGKRLRMQILLETHWLRRTVQSAIDELEALIVGDPKAPVPTPKVLVFSWGSRVIKPLVLTSINVQENGFLGGEVSSAVVDLEFAEIPPDDADPTSRARLLESERAKAQILTERQKADATASADELLNKTLSQLPKKVQEAVKTGQYELTANDAGIVTMNRKDEKKTVLGVVGRYRNRKIETEAQKFID